MKINTWHFSDFLHEVAKVELNYFLGCKNLVLRFWGQMGSKWGFLSFMKNWRSEFWWFFALSYGNIKTWNWRKWFYQKSVRWTFLIFACNYSNTQMIFFGKILHWDVWTKNTQNELFEFYNKSMHLICLIFYVKLQRYKGWKQVKTYNGETYFNIIATLDFMGQKVPEMGLEWNF